MAVNFPDNQSKKPLSIIPTASISYQTYYHTMVEIALRCTGMRRFATTVLKLFTSGPAAVSRRNRPFGDNPFPLLPRCLSVRYSCLSRLYHCYWRYYKVAYCACQTKYHIFSRFQKLNRNRIHFCKNVTVQEKRRRFVPEETLVNSYARLLSISDSHASKLAAPCLCLAFFHHCIRQESPIASAHRNRWFWLVGLSGMLSVISPCSTSGSTYNLLLF